MPTLVIFTARKVGRRELTKRAIDVSQILGESVVCGGKNEKLKLDEAS